ncbi:precorrin-4/cobalt-precorrin-4 C11-methyltransferase [Actinocrispum wychmicini]|uniref:Precorrin-4/cobalt-precorrin-4 C11-methyltransferase n=1 Tax=Actinocrispum wychmicini TaxID=1213861 RepID=A0A4R2JE99_9PSEU|nr:precorrin-4/cobalt-precorrin-4 C11-methyltransferase [Actinocrispum wychmicini]
MVLWTPSVVDGVWVRENTKAGAELVDTARHAEDDLVEIYRRAVRDKLRVVRLHGGDLATWGGLRAQLDVCARIGLTAEVIAGVSPVSAAAVSVGAALTEPDVADSVISAGQETTGMPDLDQIKQYAQFGTTMAVLVPAARAGELVEALRGGGYDDETPVVAAYKVTWPDETVVRTTVGDLVATVKQHRLWRHTLFIVGGVLRPAGRTQTAATRKTVSEGSVVRWSRNRSTWTKRAVEKPVETPVPTQPEPKPKKVTVVADPAKKAAAASSMPKKTVTAQAKKPTPAKTGGKQPARTAAKKTTRAQPQRGRRV